MKALLDVFKLDLELIFFISFIYERGRGVHIAHTTTKESPNYRGTINLKINW